MEKKRKVQLHNRIRPVWLVLAGLLVAAVIVWRVSTWTYAEALDSFVKTGEERLTLYSSTLRAALSRYAYLPYVLSHNEAVRSLLAGSGAVDGVDYYLESLNREAGSEALYVMDIDGDTLAASNWRDEHTYAGQNYGFRPYFLDAKAGRRGWYFGIGATTGQPGYFMSHPVFEDSEFLGAVIVKVDLAPLQDDWHQGGETVLVSDSNGVLFLSSRADWRYRTLTPLGQEQIAAIQAGKQYGNQALALLDLKPLQTLAEGKQIVRYQGEKYLMLSRPLPDQGWQIHHLLPLAAVDEREKSVAVIGSVLALLFLAFGMYVRERRQKQISRRKAQEAEAIREMNLRLQDEVAERIRTEKALRAAQDELVQTGKLAALGHMAAGIVHELNQPIAAIRTHSASCRLLLERNNIEQVRETLVSVSRITDHMASITAQLKIFAHKAPKRKEQVVLQDCLDEVLGITGPLLTANGIKLHCELPESPLVLAGERAKIKQVLVNLIGNAVDAMLECPEKNLWIEVTADNVDVELTIRDSGPGIAKEYIEEIFTPFFTTKDVGEGLGLGLSISYRIVSDLGGTIRAQNLAEGGARFVVRLPRRNF